MPDVKKPGHAYFHGYIAEWRHPHMPATGSNFRCELCGHSQDSDLHQEPFHRPSDNPNDWWR